MSVQLYEVFCNDTVEVETWDGKTVTGTVTGVFEDIKNGRPGIDYRVYGQDHWAYLSQVLSATR